MSEGKKFDGGKAPMDLISASSLNLLANVLQMGAAKYGRFNWASGINYSRITSAIMRHLSAWNDGIDLDEESGLSHLGHAMAGLMFLIDYQDRGLTYLDDRKPPEFRKK